MAVTYHSRKRVVPYGTHYRLADILDHEGCGVDVPDPSPCLRDRRWYRVIPGRIEDANPDAQLRISKSPDPQPVEPGFALPRAAIVRQLRRDLLQQRHRRFSVR